jgi:hypothetical protein
MNPIAPLIVLPTLDGSKEAAIERLEAWSTRSLRRRLADVDTPWRSGTLGEHRDQLDLLGVAS